MTSWDERREKRDKQIAEQIGTEDLVAAYEKMNNIWDELNATGVFYEDIYNSLYSLIQTKLDLLDKDRALDFLNRLQNSFIHETSFLKPSNEEKQRINDISAMILAGKNKLSESERPQKAVA